MARPKKNANDRKTEYLNVRWTIDEWLSIDRHAEKLGYKTKSEYIRDVVLREMKIWGN